MPTVSGKILSVDEETKLLQPIDSYVNEIQKKVDALRADGTTRVVELQSSIDAAKSDRVLTKAERDEAINGFKVEMEQAKKVEAQNKGQIDKLVADAENYLKAHYETEYLAPVKVSCAAEREAAKVAYQKQLAKLEKEHQEGIAGITDQAEIKEEKYVYKNKQFDAKVTYQQELQQIKDREHEAFAYRYHLIDLLRIGKFTFAENMAQRWENYKYTFNTRTFLLNNGLYIAIALVFIALCAITPVVKGTQLLTTQNVLNIFQQASPRMFLALGVAGLILQTGTDLSIGRMVGMSMVASTIIMHAGPNTGTVFGIAFDFSTMPVVGQIILALVVCVVLCTAFSAIAGFFTAKFKMHWFISTMANMLIIFGLVTYATKGVSFGSIEPSIPSMMIPKIGDFPTIILWAVAAIAIVWFIWSRILRRTSRFEKTAAFPCLFRRPAVGTAGCRAVPLHGQSIRGLHLLHKCLGGSVHIPPCGQQQQTQHQQDHNGIPVSFHKHLFQTVPSGAVFFCISTDRLPLYSSNNTFFRVVCRSASRASSAASSIPKNGNGFPCRQPCR